jgi:arginine exporter protein ArgO
LLAVPEPASLALLCTGLAGAGALRRRKPCLIVALRSIGVSHLLNFAAPRAASVLRSKSAIT